jgi:radical SAM protein with 4Fe4S-binding SPASM domain
MSKTHAEIPELRLLFWESTARCNLHCAHCRRLDVTAEATRTDLTAPQARALIDSASALGGRAKPIFVFSGGEPLLRSDWRELALHARQAGLITALATNGTLIDPATADRIAQAGFHRVSVSIDAPQARTHDSFRGMAGAFASALAGIAALRAAGVPVQVNMTIYAGNADQLQAVYDLARDAGAAALHLFVLVPVGCGLEIADSQQLSAAQCEAVLKWIVQRHAEGPLELKATCAPQFYRVARQWLRDNPDHGGAERVKAMLRGRGCMAGTGVIFVSHAGEVFPCGYFPARCGNVLVEGLERIWRESPVLTELRRFGALEGKCGVCEHKMICGGCRARGYHLTGRLMADDPTCLHQPAPAR